MYLKLASYVLSRIATELLKQATNALLNLYFYDYSTIIMAS